MSLSDSLKLKHIFGLKGDVVDNVHYLEEQVVLYPAGYNVVLYNTDRKTQRFITLPGVNGGNDTLGDISALAVSSLKHSHAKNRMLAVAERGERPSVSVYDLGTLRRRGKTSLSTNEVMSNEFVSMCFSPDGKYLLTQGGGPDWTLVNWQWEKGRALQYAKVSNQSGAPIHQCSFCPTDPTVVCVSGNGILRFLHLEQSEFKSIPFSMGKREPQNYMCHTWIDDRILVGTDTGDILVFENAEFRGVLESSPSDGKSIDSIAAFTKGFVCGCDEGVLYVFERDDREIYKQSKSFQIDGNYVRIKNIAISPQEDNVTCTLENNQAYVLGLSNTDILKAEEMNFEPLALPFHHLQITGLDVCVRKPLVVTCGMDRSVRVWNYQTKTIEVMRFFNEQPYCVSFHPSGLHLLVGFSDNLRLINILMDELRPYKDFAIKGCRECRFSNGGQFFAAVNGSVIQLFATYTCDQLGSFNAHNGKVRSLHWKHDDSTLFSAGMDGAMYEWKLKDGSHTQEVKQGGSLYSVSSSAEDKVYVVGSDQHLKVIEKDEIKGELDAGVNLTQVCMLHPRPPNKDQLLFTGTEGGEARVFQLPLEGKMHNIQVHSGSIIRMAISPDNQHMFTVSEDGCLAIFEIEQKDTRMTNRRTRVENALPWAEEILVTKSNLEEKMALMNELQHKVEELQNHNELQLQLRDMTYREKERETEEKYRSELEIDKKRLSELEDEKEQMERQYAQKVESLNSVQGRKLRDLESHHVNKMTAEKERYDDLMRRGQIQQEKWKEQTESKEQQYGKSKEDLRLQYKIALEKERDRWKKTVKEREEVIQEFEETKTLMEEDADTEIDELKMSYDKKFMLENRTTLNLKDQNGILQRKFRSLLDDIDENLNDLAKMKTKQATLYAEIETLEKDIKCHQKEIKERDSTIDDKDQRILELQKKNQELEKFKFVLDYKIEGLQRQIEPRKREIMQLNEQIDQMKAELRGYKKENAHLLLEVKELNLKFNGMVKEIDMRKKDREKINTLLRRFKRDLHEVHLQLEDPKALKDGVKQIYQRHVTSELSTRVAADDDVHKDYQRQRHYLERSVDSLNTKLKKDMKVHQKDNQRIMQENIALIKEINQLRREIQQMRAAQILGDGKQGAAGAAAAGARGDSQRQTQIKRDIEMQQEQIRALRNQLALFQNGDHNAQQSGMVEYKQ